MENNIKLILADDKAMYRTALKEALECFSVSIIGEAGNGKELLTLLSKTQPDVVLLDLEMPVMNGNITFDAINKNFPDVKVIILSFYFESLLVEDYIQRGAKGYIPKEAVEPELLVDAITRVHNGETFIYEKPPNKERFTARQKEIMQLVFEGLTNDDIAEEVHITKRAVEKQRQKIYMNSGAEKAIDFYKYAFSRGLQFLGRFSKQLD